MKKSVIFLLVLLLSLTGCGEADIRKSSVERQVTALVKYMTTVKSLEADVQVTFDAASDGIGSEETFDLNVLADNLKKPEELMLEMDLDMRSLNMDAYVTGGALYANVLGSKFKIELSDYMPETTIKPESIPSVIDTSKDFIKKIESKVVGENVELTFEPELDLDAIKWNDENKIYQNMTVSKYDMVVVTEISKFGELLGNTISIDMTVSFFGQSMDMEFVISIEYSNINKTEVTLPDDLDEYKSKDNLFG